MKKWTYKANTEESEPTSTPIFLNIPATGNDQYAFGGIRCIENKIFFYADIDSTSAVELNKMLIETDIKLQNTKNTLGDEYTPVCHLHLSSNGGEIFSAFAIVDTIRQMKSKVYTYVDGAAASAATLVLLAGEKRYMGKYSHLLIHQLSGGMYGKFNEMEDEIYNCTALMKLLKSFYKEKTKMPMKKLDEILSKDIWLNAEECQQFGIIDQII
jgi:ATP-dependent Clp protease protease subunit